MLDSLVFEIARPLLLFGVPVRAAMEALGAQKDESILDAGCGFGYLANRFGDIYYTGVDLDAERIRRGQLRHGDDKRKRFIAADICQTGLPSKSFDRTMAYGLLHHLPDDQALRCIKEMLRLTRKNIVFFDSVYTKYHLPNNLLCKLDQGKFVRREEGYLSLARQAGADFTYRYVWANNAIMKFFMMTCRERA